MKTTEFRVHCLEVVINCLYYNPGLTLRLLEENQWTQGFFTLWFNELEKFSRVHDKKLVIVALCALLELPADHIPASLQAGWSQVLTGVLNVFKSLPKAIESKYSMLLKHERLINVCYTDREQMEKLYSDGFDDEEFDGEDLSGAEGGSVDGDDDDNGDEDVVDEDAEYLEFLAQQAASNNSESEFDDLESEIEEELLFESPLDEIDPYIRFGEVFKSKLYRKMVKLQSERAYQSFFY